MLETLFTNTYELFFYRFRCLVDHLHFESFRVSIIMFLWELIDRLSSEEVNEGNDEETTQSEKNSHSKKPRWEKLKRQSGTYTKKNR